MRLPRRTLLAATALAAVPFAARAQGPGAPTDPRLSERGIGNPNAPVKVIEFFSLTCSHCAAFHKETYPRVKKELVETGAIRLIWRDFPLDQIALTAAAVARTLPVERYEGFIGTLLSSQDRWAFTRGDPLVELGKMAALAGMSKAQYDQVEADEALKRAILEQRMTAEREFSVQATPSFSFQGGGTVRNQSGNMPFERFRALVQEVKPI
jgi:protein-disulfide isomerase